MKWYDDPALFDYPAFVLEVIAANSAEQEVRRLYVMPALDGMFMRTFSDRGVTLDDHVVFRDAANLCEDLLARVNRRHHVALRWEWCCYYMGG